LSTITNSQIDLDQEQFSFKLELVKPVPAAEFNHVVDLGLHLAELFDLEVPLKPAQPELSRLTLVLVD